LQKDKTKVPILLFAGPPGVGKSSLAKSISAALKRPLQRVFLGGMEHATDLKGFAKTYVAAEPGSIMKCFIRSKCNFPVILLDEIDKVGQLSVAESLLDVLDYEQNQHYRDHYVDMEYDLSNALFIATANNIDNIPPPLLDRMELIELPSYTFEEKKKIARTHLLPKIREEMGLSMNHMSFYKETLDSIIQDYTMESGVRNLNQVLNKIGRKLVRQVVERKRTNRKKLISVPELRTYLGPPIYIRDSNARNLPPGTVSGLAYSYVGGSVLMIETAKYPKSGSKSELLITGLPGDMTLESSKVCMSLVKSNAEKLGISTKEINEVDIHIHYPTCTGSGVDGPSAGGAMFIALYSLFTGKTIDSSISTTGEVDLRGNICAIGGLREKILASYRQGKKKIIIPKDNISDLRNIPTEVLHDIKVIPVSNIWELLNAFNLKV